MFILLYPRTNIDFVLPDNGYISLEVFDINGRQISTLINAYHESGYHSVIWDGTDNIGKALGIISETIPTNSSSSFSSHSKSNSS